MNRQQRRQRTGDPPDMRLAILDDLDKNFVRFRLEIPSGDLPTVTYENEAALDRWRRFCIAFAAAHSNATQEQTEQAIMRAPSNPIEGSGCRYETRTLRPGQGEHVARLPRLDGEQIGDHHGWNARSALYALITRWDQRWYGPAKEIAYPDAGGSAQYLRDQSKERSNDPIPATVRVGRWRFAFSSQGIIQLFSAQLITSASLDSDWAYLGSMCQAIGVPDPPDRYALGDTIRMQPEAVHKWLWHTGEPPASFESKS